MNDSNKIRVMIVDDHSMVRKGLAAFINVEADMELVAEAGSGRKALQLCEQHQPDVILMDMLMPGMDGTTTTRLVREKWPQTQVIALTSFNEKEIIYQVLQAGAISYLLKNITAEGLAQAIRAARDGRSTLAPEATQALIETANQGAPPGHDLTPREREVLALLVDGCSNPQIAADLSVSRSTARAHVSNVLSKLGVSNRAEAITLAFRHKLVT